METLWRGNANAWECDELGHLNVRFYLAKATEAVAGLAERLGMREAFTSRATATLIARELTVRFLAEARPGAPLSIRGGVLSHDATSMEIALMLDHAARGEPAAAFTVRLDHAAPSTGKVFNWSARTRVELERLTVERPAETRARSLSTDPPEADISLSRADALGLQETGRGRINPDEVDAFGRMRAEFTFGKISNSVIHFSDGFPEEWAAHAAGRELDAAGAVLEARILFRGFPRAGSGYVVRSGLTAASDKVRTLVHWVCDPVTGAGLWSMEAVAGLMDLNARRLKPATPEQLAAMEARRIDGLKA